DGRCESSPLCFRLSRCPPLPSLRRCSQDGGPPGRPHPQDHWPHPPRIRPRLWRRRTIRPRKKPLTDCLLKSISLLPEGSAPPSRCERRRRRQIGRASCRERGEGGGG